MKKFKFINFILLLLLSITACNEIIDDTTPYVPSSECKLLEIGFYVRNDPTTYYEFYGYKIYKGEIEDKDVNITLPLSFKNSTFYIAGKISSGAKLEWEKEIKQLNYFYRNSENTSEPGCTTEKAQILFNNNTNKYTITVIAADEQHTNTYTLNVTWKLSVEYHVNGARTTDYNAPIDRNFYDTGDRAIVKGVGDIYKYTNDEEIEALISTGVYQPGKEATFLYWTDGINIYQEGDEITLSGNGKTLTAIWSKYAIGENITAIDIFGNSVSGDVVYIRIPKKSDVYSTKYKMDVDEDGDGEKDKIETVDFTYNVMNANNKDWMYLIADMTPIDASWSSTTTSISGTSNAIGAGKTNSEKIKGMYSNSLAASLYITKKMYLPSQGEMNLIMDKFNSKFEYNTLGKIYTYWTSTQATTDATKVCVFEKTYSGNFLDFELKTSKSSSILGGSFEFHYYGIGVSYIGE